MARLAFMILLVVAFSAGAEADMRRKKAASAVQQPVNGPVVTQIGLKQDESGTHVFVDISREIVATVSAMTEPQRLLLDFPATRFHAPSLEVKERHGTIRQVRFGAFMRGQGRVVLDLGKPAIVEEQRFVPLDGGGFRLAIRLKETTTEAFAALAHPVSDDIITGTTPAKAQSPDDLPVVVLDPGHGGVDPGASGPGGELEKTIVLQFALAMKERLEKGGKAKVVMTRATDVFVPLRERVRIARQSKAALFVSLHADALPDEGDVRGASVYVLSDRATDERSEKLAAKENLADLAAGLDLKDDQDEVTDILFDLARRESRAFSNQFARGLVATLPKATRMHKNALRGASFRVLRAPDVPSVLIELGYLTASDEAKMMLTEEWRIATAGAASEAIERFLAERIARDRDKP
ncbi:MAG: N-acetylmuramoyl-L-alanine amidase [Beijerinckiaceae bacterium]